MVPRPQIAAAGDDVEQPVLAKLLVALVDGLGDAVAVDGEQIAWRRFQFGQSLWKEPRLNLSCDLQFVGGATFRFTAFGDGPARPGDGMGWRFRTVRGSRSEFVRARQLR